MRYFVMKCVSYNNLEIALQNHIWATQAHNEVKLNQAYRVRLKITFIKFLFLSFLEHEWICVCDLPFHESKHLHNPLNENLKISRDGQEIPEDIGTVTLPPYRQTKTK